MHSQEQISKEQWAGFQSKATKVKQWGPRRGVGEITISEPKEVVVGEWNITNSAGRRSWGWSLGFEDDETVRLCWVCHNPIPKGRCGVYVSSRRRPFHVGCVTPDGWHNILGQPRGGDPSIMGAMRSRWTREAKKAMT